MYKHFALAAASTVVFTGAAHAASVDVTFTNNQAAGGLYLTPLAAIFHDGTFDSFDDGALASAEVEALAETGNPAPLLGSAGGAATGVLGNPAGFGGAPVLDPGETATLTLTLDETTQRFFSFMSMVIPSNDLFIGNDNAMAYEVFDIAGSFKDLGTISIFGADVWDAGTEANNNLGAAFNALGGSSFDQTNFITQGPDLSILLGSNTAAGTTISSVPGAGDLLATISISQTVAPVPLPAALPLLLSGIGALGLAARRRKARKTDV